MDDIKNKFDEYQEDYIDLHDFFAGERQVKEKGTRYTPMLEGQEKSKNSSAMYDKYKSFGILYNALARTRQGLKGAILRKPIDIQFPDRQKDLLNKIMLNGASFNDLTREITDAVLGYGRIGALVDMRNEIPYVSLYNALSIIEWPEIIIEGVEQRIILSEMVEVIDPKDPSKMKIVEQRRYLELDEHGEYIVTVKQKTDETNDLWVAVLSTPENPNPVMPSYKGKRLTTIPFSFIGSSNNTPTPSRPPLLDLLNLLKGHWKLTVAYQYGLNFAGLPTPCFAGFNFDADAEIPLGPGAVHHTPEPGAKSWFMSTGGIGLVEMAAGLDRLEKQMAVVGARLLEEQRPGVESAETV